MHIDQPILITSLLHGGDMISFQTAKEVHNLLLYLATIKNSTFIALHDFALWFEKQDFYFK
jgi:hypothetical protein